jgi:hypothetical protein
MPRIKRWFHCSQDLNRDPEFREFAKKFGLGGVRFWLEALAVLDRTDNYWNLHKEFDLGLLAGTCETTRRIIQGSFEHLRDINWLRVGIDPDQKLFIYAPKWAEYNQRREDKGNMLDTTRYQESTYPTPSPTPSPNKEIYKEKVPVLDTSNEHFEEFWKAYPPRNGKKLGRPATLTLFLKLSLEDQLLAIQSAKNYASSELVKAGIGIKDPNRFMRSGKSYEYWREWIEPEQKTTVNGSPVGGACNRRIDVDGRLKPCGQPARFAVGKSPMCEACHQAYQDKRGDTEQLGVGHAD